MASTIILCCDRCGALYDEEGNYWIKKEDGEQLHFCSDGKIGKKTKVKKPFVEKKLSKN